MQRMPLHQHPALAGINVFERGWLSSNNVLIHDEAGATLIDTSHVNHAEQTLALVRHALAEKALARIVNTHLHSDHCGGNATLQRACGAAVFVPEASANAVREWSSADLSFDPSGQRCERFTLQGTTRAGDMIEAGGRRFEVIEAPGHDPQSTILFDAAHGLLISADALWENGFGVVFPELEGEPGFDDVGAVLDKIERLPVQLVVPGHGAPFSDVGAAIARSRARLAAFVAEPRRHARHGAKVLMKYHLMEVRTQPLDELLLWAEATPLFGSVWQAHGRSEAPRARDWAGQLANELIASGALRRAGLQVHDV
jgi:glyoxylase-like metal-dependent hydrolase (beta-lactamase superfamily II)